MSKLSPRAEHYFDQLRQSQFGNKFGNTYIEALAMLDAVKVWADVNFDDWLYLDSDPESINNVKIGELVKLLQNRINECEGYYRQSNGVYTRDSLLEFVKSK